MGVLLLSLTIIYTTYREWETVTTTIRREKTLFILRKMPKIRFGILLIEQIWLFDTHLPIYFVQWLEEIVDHHVKNIKYTLALTAYKVWKRNSSKQMKWKLFNVSKINDEIIARKLTSILYLLWYVFHHFNIDQKKTYPIFELFMLKWMKNCRMTQKYSQKFRNLFQIFEFLSIYIKIRLSRLVFFTHNQSNSNNSKYDSGMIIAERHG